MPATAHLSVLDLGVIGLYIVALIAVGFINVRKSCTTEEQFLAGKSARWPQIGFALYASTISITSLVGLTGSAYAHGIGVFNYEWMAPVVLCVSCAVVLPVYLRSKIFTVPEFLELRFGRFARTYVSGLSIGLGVFLEASGALFAGAVLFQILFPDWPFWMICTLLAGLAGVFLIIGGLRAVIFVESIQGFVLVVVCSCLAFFTFKAVGGWEVMMTRLEATHLKLIKPADDPIMPWTGLLTGIPLIGFYFWSTNQLIVQRVLAAKSLDDGRWGSLMGGALKLTNLFLVILPGAAAVLIFPHLDKPDQVFSHLLFKVMPPGLIGLVVAAGLISILSALAAAYNSCATLLTMDFIKRFKPDMDELSLVRMGRLATLVFMLISIVWAPQILLFKDTLWQYLQSVLCYFVPPVAALFLTGLFAWRANRKGAAAGLMIGTASSFGLFFGVEILHVLEMHFLICAMVIFVISVVSIVLGSLIAPPPNKDEISGLMFSKAIWKAETESLRGVPVYQNYRYISVALLAVTAVIVILFA